MKSLSRENQADFVEAFNSTSRYDNIYFDQIEDRIYPTELQLNPVYNNVLLYVSLDLY